MFKSVESHCICYTIGGIQRDGSGVSGTRVCHSRSPVCRILIYEYQAGGNGYRTDAEDCCRYPHGSNGLPEQAVPRYRNICHRACRRPCARDRRAHRRLLRPRRGPLGDRRLHRHVHRHGRKRPDDERRTARDRGCVPCLVLERLGHGHGRRRARASRALDRVCGYQHLHGVYPG